jgi:hypothetical protein
LANGVGPDHFSEQDLGDLLIVGRQAGARRNNVLQDEATEAESKSGRPMFGDRFPT